MKTAKLIVRDLGELGVRYDWMIDTPGAGYVTSTLDCKSGSAARRAARRWAKRWLHPKVKLEEAG